MAVIIAEDISAGYTDRVVWAGANFEIEKGDFVAVLGPNGAGKSTLFRLILGLANPAQGTLKVLGDTPRQASRHIGYIPQSHKNLNESALLSRELVKVGYYGNRFGMNLKPREANDKADEALGIVDALSLGNKPVHALSGGELQRIYLAQALISEPKILLLDEPLSNLDIRRENELVNLISKLIKERDLAVLLIAHDMNPLLPYVNKIIYIANGHVASGSPEKVLTEKNLTKLYESPIEILHDKHGRPVILGAAAGEHHA